MRWTRVQALSEFEEGAARCYQMTDDVLEAKQDMEDITLTDLSVLLTFFDPVKW